MACALYSGVVHPMYFSGWRRTRRAAQPSLQSRFVTHDRFSTRLTHRRHRLVADRVFRTPTDEHLRDGTGRCDGARDAPTRLRYPYTQADIDFMSGMIHHHAQAITISRWAPSHGASAAVQRLTARIINAQTDEIR